jgi:hypothetical protein
MNSKFIYPAFFLIGAQILFSGCCKQRVYADYIYAIFVNNSDGETELENQSTIKQEDFRISCKIETETRLEASNAMPSDKEVNTASFMFGCRSEVYYGNGNWITNVEIYCNKEIWGIKPGNIINVDDNIMAYYKIDEDSISQLYTINEWKDMMPNYYDSYFVFQKEINSDEYLKFYFKFNLNNRTEIECRTKEVKLN